MNQQELQKTYPEINSAKLVDTLGTTIKRDNDNKLVAFLCQLSAYTEDSQLNLSFNAPSSSGKSFIPMEIATLFPSEDVLELGYVTPTAFFHDAGQFDKEKQQYLVNLEHKIIIFLDQPHTMLLEHLRPLLSHDKKEIEVKITDKTQKFGLKTKTVILRGYPAVVFCSAGLRLDEQEATRFLLLSPEITQEKLREGILESFKKAADRDAYWDKVNLNPARQQLRGRIQAIRDAGVTDVRISSEDQTYVIERFFGCVVTLKPRHQRDIKRLVAIIKAFALLNLWHRPYAGSGILASRSDIEEAFDLWDRISITQELNIPPYVYKLYEEIILAVYNEKNIDRSDDIAEVTGSLGVNRQEVQSKHYAVYGRMLDSTVLRQQILPMLCQAGLITEERDPADKRNKLIYPLIPKKYSEHAGGVAAKNKKILEDVQRIFGGGELIH